MTDPRADDAILLAALAGILPERQPDPDTAARLRAALLARIGAGGAAVVHVIRREQGEWRTLLPGVEIKSLRRDDNSGTQTTLWRVQPGARVPPHVHSHEEECLVLEGVIVHDGIEYFAGDYLLARAGDRHQAFEAPQGALFLIRGELVPEPS